MGPSAVRCPRCGHTVLTGMRPGRFYWRGTHSLAHYVLRSAIVYLAAIVFLAVALGGKSGASGGRLAGLIAGYTLLTFTLNGLWYRFRCRQSDRRAFGIAPGAEGAILHLALVLLFYVAAIPAFERAGAPHTAGGTIHSYPGERFESDPSFLAGTWETDHFDRLRFQVEGHKIVGGRFRYKSDGSMGIILRGYLTAKQAHYEWKDASRRGRATVVLRPDGTLVQTSRWQGRTYRCRLVQKAP